MDTIQYIKDMLLALKSELVGHRVWVGFIFTVILGAVSFLALNWPKYYESSAVIVKDVTNVIEPLLRGAAAVSDIDAREKIQDVIYSRRLLDRALRRVDTNYDSLTPEALALSLMKIRNNLSVIESRVSTNLTRIVYKSSKAEDAYTTLTAIVDVFIEDRLADKQKKSHEAHDFISDQVNQYKSRLSDAEKKLKEFKANSVDVSDTSVKARISDLRQEIERLRLTISESEEAIRTTTAQLQEETVNVAVRRKVSAIEERRVLLSDQLDQLLLVYQDSYPDVVTLKGQIKEMDIELETLKVRYQWDSGPTSELPLFEELRKQLSLAEVGLKKQKRRLKSLEQLAEKEHSLADEVASNQAELTELNRDYAVTHDLYEKMLARKENAKLTLALNDEGQGESYKLIEPPVYPLKPSGLRALYIFLVAPFIALCVPVGLALVFVVLDTRIRSVALLSRQLPKDLPLLAVIPHRSTRLGTKILRKDIILLLLLAVTLMIGYGYSLFYFWAKL